MYAFEELSSGARLGHLFCIAHRMYLGCIRCELERQGVHEVVNPALLFRLCQCESMTQRELADQLGISPPSVAMTLRRMERAGLIEKHSDPDDLRKNYITLTKKGHDYACICFRAEQRVTDQIAGSFSSEELQSLQDYYLRIIENMRELGCRQPYLHEEEPN